ncbi:MAG: hypothetical protein A3C55_03510 [Gammaproteobacteria bacterium RIFCSPHIGHO2_02_FULL_42_13]|nr:MAG: hypothetical protein A3C55_03510 [Gammaproteobacteria bacterium RIFCSPHIGHO2_02_FULL_42_13]
MKTKQALSVILTMMGLFTYNIILAGESCPSGIGAYEITQFPTTINAAKAQNLYSGPNEIKNSTREFYCLPQGTIDRQYPILSIPSDTTKAPKAVGTVQFGAMLQPSASSISLTSSATTRCTSSQIPVIADQGSNISLKWPHGDSGTVNATNSSANNIFYFSFVIGAQEYQYQSLDLQSIPCALHFYSIDYPNSRILFSLN